MTKSNETQVKIIPNKEGSMFSVPEHGKVIEASVEQLVGEEIRHGSVSGKMEDMFNLKLRIGDTLPGRITAIESFQPILPEEPEQYIKTDINGSLVRIDGKIVYRAEVYTQGDRDRLIK